MENNRSRKENYHKPLVLFIFIIVILYKLCFSGISAIAKNNENKDLSLPKSQKVIQMGVEIAEKIQDVNGIGLRLTPFNYYVQQGDGSESQGQNCGPASVAMAIRYGTALGYNPSPQLIRTFLMGLEKTGNRYWDFTGPDDFQNAFTKLGAEYAIVSGAQGVWDAVNRFHTVVVPIRMRDITIGGDVVLATNGVCPINKKVIQYEDKLYCYSDAKDVITGNYKQFAFNDDPQNKKWDGHIVLVNGIYTDTIGQKYFYVYDPNVFGSNGSTYFYLGNGAYPKGELRLWKFEDLDKGLKNNSNKAIELKHNPAHPIPIYPAVMSQETASGSLQPNFGSESIEFIEHVNYSDNSIVLPGSVILKSWRIKNSGQSALGLRYHLVQVSGSSVHAYSETELGQVQIGDTTVVNAYIRAPNQPGNYSTAWQLVNSSGNTVDGLLGFNFTVQGQSQSGFNNAIFISDLTLSDGSVVSPSQSLTKTWRMKNTGSSTWGSGYQLVFLRGDQMGAPSSINVSNTSPGQIVDLSVNITTPSTPGNYAGYWRLRNSQGTYFGPEIWVKITISNNAPPPPSNYSWNLVCTNCPTAVEPGTTFQPILRATVGSGQLLQSRGDMVRSTDNNLYGAFPHVAVTGVINAGSTYDFAFYVANPITAPSTPGTYQSKWQVWQNGQYIGPELTIQFQVQVGGGTNHAPNAPTLLEPHDWTVYTGNSGISLSVNNNGDPDGDAIVGYYFDLQGPVPTNSGWISSNIYQPQGLAFRNFEWRVKVRDIHGNESDWSSPLWHFNVVNNQPVIKYFYSESCQWGELDSKICFCAEADSGTFLLMFNSENDGSTNGEWGAGTETDSTMMRCVPGDYKAYGLNHLGYTEGTHVARLLLRGTGGWENATVRDITFSLPLQRKPSHPFDGVGYGPYRLGNNFPKNGAYLNSQNVHFTWNRTLRTSSFHLEVNTASDFTGTNLLDINLPPDTNEYSYTFLNEYEMVYWRVTSTGPYGSNSGVSGFHIDTTPPIASVTSLPNTIFDTKFTVNWSGNDARSGLQWYHIQVRDGNRVDSIWNDWLVNTTKTAEIFQGQAGHTYYFRVRAMDQVGNWENWPAGDGDTFTKVDPSSAPSVPWWNNGYSYRRNLVILNNDIDQIPSHFPVRLQFDNTTVPTAAEIYNSSCNPIKGDDLRIVYNNSIELDRFVQYFSASRIDILFPLQVSLGGNQSSSGSYQLYSCNQSANTPPANINNIFMPVADANTVLLAHFQDGSGSTILDTSGRSHNGTYYGVGWTNGLFGWAGVFNGSTSKVDFGNSSDFNLGAMTLETWVYATLNTGGYERIFEKATYWLRFSATRQPQLNAFGNEANSCQSMEINKWYHVAGTYDGVSKARVYLNGVLCSENNQNSAPRNTNEPLKIGAESNPNASLLPGYIQHVRISNIERTDFSYAKIDIQPSVSAGIQQTPPIQGNPDLATVSLNAYPNLTGGILVQAVFKNQGTLPTQNGFFNDLYVNHLPIGAGDYTGSLSFWVNDSVAAGSVITLTTVVTQLLTNTNQPLVAGSEITATLYSQIDSTGSVSETNKANNIFTQGLEVCLASPDGYEGDNLYTSASLMSLGSKQQHNFDHPGDVDWVKFNAVAGKEYLIQTSVIGDSADTYLYLYGTDGVTLLDSNDDFGGTFGSQIVWKAPSNGTYYVQIKHWNLNIGGCSNGYEVIVRNQNRVFLPIVKK